MGRVAKLDPTQEKWNLDTCRGHICQGAKEVWKANDAHPQASLWEKTSMGYVAPSVLRHVPEELAACSGTSLGWQGGAS